MKYTYILPLIALTLSCNVSKNSYKIKKDSKVVEYANTITAEELKQHLSVIASDEYEGRETGKKGQIMTAEYLKNEFIKDGVAPGNKGDYYQNFPLIETEKPDANFSVNNMKFNFLEDFYFFQSFSKIESFEIDLSNIVSVNHGIEEEVVNNYRNIDVKGKAVVISLDKVDGFESWNWRKKLEVATKNGATTVFFSSKDFEINRDKLEHFLAGSSLNLVSKEKRNKSIPFFFISNNVEIYLFGINQMNEEETIINPDLNKLKFEFISNKRTVNTSNVLGFIEGSDEKLKDEIVILTAHYDHLGIKDGVVYNGADDDGTGTVALLELAEAFQKAKNEGNGPKRSILIMPVSGEEKGLLGSKYYTENPVYPLANTVVDLNIDMIGRLDENHDKPDYVYLIGADKISKELHSVSEAANKTYTKLKLDYTFNDENDPNRFYYRSDHYNFVKKGIPVIFYFSGVHEDYHQSTDEIDKIMFDKVEHITRLVFYTAWEVANKPTRLIID